MASTRLHGKGGAIYIGGTFVSKTAIPTNGNRLTFKSEWTLNRSRDYVDATAFGDPNKVWLAGLPDISGTFRGLLDVGGDLLFNASTSDAQDLFLMASDGTLAGTTTIMVAHGPGLLDAQVTVGNADAARITGNYRASAAWTIDL